MIIKANNQEFSLPSSTSEESLNKIFGVGNWQIIEKGISNSLTSDKKAKQLGLDPNSEDWKNLVNLIKEAQGIVSKVQKALGTKGISVSVGFYIGNKPKPTKKDSE